MKITYFIECWSCDHVWCAEADLDWSEGDWPEVPCPECGASNPL